MKPARVNVRFLLILFIVVAAVVGVIGGLVYVQRRGDATRYIRAGDEFMEIEDYRQAFSSYNRAAQLEPANLEYAAKVEASLGLIKPETANEAQERYNYYLSALKRTADHHPQDAQKHLRLLGEIFQAARRGNSPSYWNLLREVAASMEERLPESDPKRPYAKLYRGASLFNAQMQRQLSQEEITRGEQQLKEFVEEVPEEELGWGVLATGQMAMVEQFVLADRRTRAQEKLQELRETVTAGREHAGDGAEVQLATARLELLEERLQFEAADEQLLQETVPTLVELVREGDDPWMTMQTVDLLATLEAEHQLTDMPRPIQLVDEYLQERPESHDMRLLKAQLHAMSNEPDQAKEQAERILDAELLPVGFLSQLQFELQRRAASLLVDLALQRWDAADGAERDERLKELAASKDRLVNLVANPELDPLVTQARAKLAFAEGRFHEATSLFDKLVREEIAVDVQTLLYAAYCLERLGQLGRARDYLDRAMERRPNHPELLMRKVHLQMRLQDNEGALKTVQALKRVSPSDEAVLRTERAIEDRLKVASGEQSDPIRQALEAADAALRAREFESAAATLRASLEENPDNLQLLHALVEVELRAEHKEVAGQHLERALELSPNDPRFLRLQVVMETDDPVERIKLASAATHEDQADRVVATAHSMWQMALSYEQSIARLESEGREAEAEEARKVLDRVRAEEQEYRKRAEELAPDHPHLLEFRFISAVQRKDWEAAKAVTDEAVERDLDLAGGSMYRGQYHFARGNYEEAVRAYRRATLQIPYSALAWRWLGLSYERLGNSTEAIDALDTSYRNNPNDVETLLAYATILSRTGNSIRALELMRTGRRLAPDHSAMRRLWLALETEVGDPAVVLRERTRLYERQRDLLQKSGEAWRNAAALASFYGRTPPARELILDEEGNERYIRERWRRMPSQEQSRILERTQREWYGKADALLEETRPDISDPQKLGDYRGWALLKAELLRVRGEVESALATLNEAVEHQETPWDRLSALLVLGAFQQQLNRSDDAVATYERAREFQDPQKLEADHAIGLLMLSEGRFKEALPHLEAVAQVRPMGELKLQIAESHAKLQQYDKARRAIQEAVEEAGEDHRSLLIEATIVAGEARKLWTEGESQLARRKEAEHERLLARAEQMDPTDPTPHVLRAQQLLARFYREGEVVLLDDAMRSLSRADDAQLDNLQTSLARVDVLRARGDVAGAINELTNYLNRTPDNTVARDVLLQMQLSQGRVQQAVDQLEEAVERRPNSLRWLEQLGDLYRSSAMDDPASAAVKYRAALALAMQEGLDAAPVPRLVNKYAQALLRQRPPDFRSALTMLQQHGDVLDDPFVRATYAWALQEAGRSREALDELRAAYHTHRQLVADGAQPPAAVSGWFATVDRIFDDRGLAAAESFAIDVTGGLRDPHEMLALALLWRMEGSAGLSRATELLEGAIGKCPQDNTQLLTTLYSELGFTRLAAGQRLPGLEAFEKVVQLDPENSYALNNTAYLIADLLGEPERALAYARRAVELKPDDPSILDTIGWVHFLRGAYGEAEEYLRRSGRLRETAINQVHLAHLAVQQGDTGRARRYLQRAAELKPDAQTEREINRLTDTMRTGSASP